MQQIVVWTSNTDYHSKRVQTVLDLDLDIFVRPLNSRCKESRVRADSKVYRPMSKDEILSSLDDRLMLSPNRPIPGLVSDFHKDVYYQWRDLIARGMLIPPFEVVHVDGHADLGCGDCTFASIQEEWIYEVDKMRDPPEGGYRGLGSGNYLAFAIANGWVHSLTYACHEDEPNDLPRLLFKDWRTDSGVIEIKKVPNKGFGEYCSSMILEPIRYEPVVSIPFSQQRLDTFTAAHPFDYVFVARSPSYTPKELDFVDKLIDERISLIEWERR